MDSFKVDWLSFSRGMAVRTASLLAIPSLLLVVFCCQTLLDKPARAAVLYWDSNGAVAGYGTLTTGTWGTSAYWSTDPNGSVATTAYTANSDVYFSAGTHSLTHTVTVSGTQTASKITLEDGTPTFTSGTISLTGGEINVSTATATINSILSSSVLLSKTGSGTLTLGGVNTYTGGLEILDGIVKISLDSRLGSTTVPTKVILNGGTLNPTATFAFTGNRTFQVGSAGGTLEVNPTFTTTLGNKIEDVTSQNGILNKTGTGTLALTGSNTYSGATNIQAGILTINQSSGLGTSAAGTTIADGAMLTISRNIDLGNESFSLQGTGVGGAGVLNSILGLNRIGGPVVMTGDSTIGVTSRELQLDGAVSGNFAITKIGNSTLTLSGANNYTGLTNIQAGVLLVKNNSGLGTSATGTVVSTGATLALQGGINVGTEALTIAGIGQTGFGALRSVSGTNQHSGSVVMTADSRISVLQDTLHLQGDLSGGFNMTKVGNGILALHGNNNFGGSTTVRSGTLELDYTTNNTDKIDSGFGLVLNDGRIRVLGSASAPTSQSVTGTILESGASEVQVISGTGQSATVNLNAITRNTGGTINFILPASGAITTTNLNDATGILGGYATVAGTNWAANDGANNIVPLASYQTKNDVTTWVAGDNITNSGAFTGSRTTASINSLRFNQPVVATTTITAANTLTIDSGGILVTGNVGNNLSTITGGNLTSGGTDLIFHQHNSANGMTVASVITGSNSLTKSGAGQLTLTGTNNYTGSTYINDGTLSINADLKLGTAPATPTTDKLVLNGGTLNTTASFTMNINRGITLGAEGGTFSPTSGTLSYQGKITGTGDLIKEGAGTLALSGLNPATSPGTANDYTGTVYVNSGVISLIGQYATLAFGSTEAPTYIGPNGIVSYDSPGPGANIQMSEHIYLNGGTYRQTQSTNTNHLGNLTLMAPMSTLSNTAATLQFVGPVDGIGGFTRAGGGVITFSNANNTYLGPSILNAGTTNVGASSSLGSTSELQVNNVSTSATVSTTLLTLSPLAITVGSLSGTIARPDLGHIARINIAGTNGILTVNQTKDGTYGGEIIGGTGSLVLGSPSTHKLTLTGTSTYGGRTSILGGTLSIGKEVSIGTVPAALNATSLTINGGALELTDTFAMSSNRGIVVGSSIGAIDVAADKTFTYGGVIGNVTGQAGVLHKRGAGTLVLTGTNTYTGLTQIQAGELDFSGSLATSGVTIFGDATLSGAGNILGGVTVLNNGKLDVGHSIGTLNTGGLTVNQGGKVVWELNALTDTPTDAGIAWDLITLNTGNLLIDQDSILEVDFGLLAEANRPGALDTFWGEDHLWRIITKSSGGTSSGYFGNVNLLNGTLSQGMFSTLNLDGDVYLSFTAATIPEPSTGGLLILGLIAFHRRNRRKNS